MRKIMVLGLFIFTGCSIFNPYNSNFTCPKTFNGKCVSPTTAYQESLDTSPKEKDDEGLKALKNDEVPQGKKGTAFTEASYQSALYERLTGLLKEPTTPMIAPPQVMRVLILPYKGDGSKLYMPRYVYIIVDEAKWVMGNQWINENSGARATLLPRK